jgi:hypothetical protein
MSTHIVTVKIATTDSAATFPVGTTSTIQVAILNADGTLVGAPIAAVAGDPADTAYPLVAVFSAVNDGSYTLTAIAVDAAGNHLGNAHSEPLIVAEPAPVPAPTPAPAPAPAPISVKVPSAFAVTVQ